MDNDTISLSYGVLTIFKNPIEKQLQAQNYTLGDKADYYQDIATAIVKLHIAGILTDSQYDKAIIKFQNKMLVKDIRRLENE